jgi:hypothetical protein
MGGKKTLMELCSGFQGEISRKKHIPQKQGKISRSKKKLEWSLVQAFKLK